MNKYFFSLFFLLFFINPFYSQNKSVNINFGVSSEGKFANGQYFSCDVRLPIAKSLYISPTFTFSNSIPSYTNGILLTQDQLNLMYSKSELEEKFVGRKFGSLDLLILFKPLDLLKNKTSKHELVVGSGYGIKSDILMRIFYNRNNDIPELTLLHYNSGTFSDFYLFKFDYNYTISENTYLGFTTSTNIVDSGIILTGLQFGVKF
jgi:hypothetical protein